MFMDIKMSRQEKPKRVLDGNSRNDFADCKQFAHLQNFELILGWCANDPLMKSIVVVSGRERMNNKNSIVRFKSARLKSNN